MRRKIIPFVLSLGLVASCGPSPSAVDAGGDPSDASTDPCTGSETRCQGNTFQMCVDGVFENQDHCAALCHAALGCIQCNPDFGNTCVGDEIHSCESDGSIGGLISTCPPGTCNAGVCVDECAEAAASDSYIGCEYWPVDLRNAIEVIGEPLIGSCALVQATAVLLTGQSVCNNPSPPGIFDPTVTGFCEVAGDCDTANGYSCATIDVCALDAQHSPFAIVVSNPHNAVVPVTLTNAGGGSQVTNVPALSVASIYPQQLSFADASIVGTGIFTNAYKLTSTRPVVAYQFSPLDNVGVFSNDGSLLLPEHTFDTKYYAITMPTLDRGINYHSYHGYVTVVASAEGSTEIDVTVPCDTLSGPSVTAITAGNTGSFTLTQGQTLTIEADGEGDLTGTLIAGTNDKAFGVFAGHEANVIYSDPVCCADHLEDQVFPASTWGTVYAVARSQPRASEPDRLRIIAQREDTTTAVTFNPAPTVLQGNCAALAAGEFCEVDITGDTEVSSPEPIMIAHMLLSTGGTGDTSGDPALAFAVPTEQFRNDYKLLVPAEYAHNYFAIVAPADSTVTLDATDITSSLTSFGSGTYRAGRFPVDAGPHTLTCTNSCGVEVMGYDEAVSYLFAGGLDLETIVVD